MRDERILMLKILALAIALTFSACQKSAVENNSLISSQTPPSVSPTLDFGSMPAPNSETSREKLYSSIRKIDFKNFTYPWTKDLSTKDEKTFTLKDGEIPFEREGQMGVSLAKIEYADVTGDGADEAILIISLETGGSAVPNIVYVYTVESEKPKLLWSFDTGDRAQGGLKRVYEENRRLVVETFGDNKFENDKWEFKFPKKIAGYCCPTAYTKIRLKWNGEKFAVEGKPELFDYDWKHQNKEIN